MPRILTERCLRDPAPDGSHDELDDVVGWRWTQLIKSGWDRRRGLAIAAHVDIDLHLACEMVEQHGCEPELALRVLL